MEPQAASSDAPLLGRGPGSNEASVLPARRRRALREFHCCSQTPREDGSHLLCCSPEVRLLHRRCDCAPAGGTSNGAPVRLFGRKLSGQTGNETGEGHILCSWTWCCLTNSKFQQCSTACLSPGKQRLAERECHMPQQSKHDFFQSEYLRVEEFSSEVEKLQDVLYCHSRDILSAEDVHVLRHVLRAERTGPLKAGEVNMLHQLLSHTEGDALSSLERRLFISLLRKKTNGDAINSEEEVTLRTLLLRALANSLSSEQQLNVYAALQKKMAVPMSPYYVDDLHRILTRPDHQQCKSAVQAALEEQLAPYCGWAQQMAIHRLLFLEPPWPLSREERHLLENLYVQPAVWWSPAQENRFFTTLAERRVRGALNPDEEPIQLLLQLLSASLTPPQRQHLAALLGVPHSQRASHQPPTILSTEHTAVPTPGQMRTMALLQRVLEGETLSPVENGLLQEGILRELLQLLPCEDVQVLYSLVLSSDPIPVRRYGVPILEELQSARALWESGGNIMGYVRQIGSSGLRQLFIYCLAASLTFQQRKIISQLLGENPEKQKPDEEQEGSQDTSAGMQPGVYPANCPLHGEAVGDRATEDPKARCGREKEVCSAAKVAGGGPADLQMESMIALTREQAGMLEHLLELRHAGCQASREDDVLADVLSRFKFSGPAFDHPLQLVHQLLLSQFSTSLSETQEGFIRRITSAAQSALHPTEAHSGVRIGCTAPQPAGDKSVQEACQLDAELITPSQRQLLQWLLLQKVRRACACVQGSPARQGIPSLIMDCDSPTDLRIIVPLQPLLQLATSISEAQVEMLLLLLDGILETPTDPGSDGAEKDETVTEIEGGSTKDELLGPQQVVTSASPRLQMQHLIPLCSSISTEESSDTKKTDASANLSICRTEGVPCHSAATTKHQEEYQGADSASPHALSPIDVSATRQSRGAEGGQLSVRAQLDGAPDCDLSSLGENVGSKARTDGELQTNGKIVADLPGSQLYREQWSSPLTCSPEDLANRRRMVKQLILEAADRRIFLEDLKMWRQQYNQRAKLREVLNPYILKIQTLQQGYLKRCPCLYHQQQDQQEEEERQANLKLLDSLESSIWGAGDQSPTQTRSFSFQGAFSSEELQEFGSEEFGTLNHGDSASSGGLSLASAFRQTANTPVGRTFSKERYPSNRQQSLVSSSECCSLEREISRSSTGSENRRSSSSPVVKPPSHCSSLGSAPLLGSCEGQSPSSSPTRLRSPAVSRAERHQRGGSREESVSRGDLEVSVEERKKRMQQQAMEKAQRVKEDARVAFLVVFMKQLQPGTPALGIEMADRINLSHLNSKTLPKGKGWKTQGLLRMIDGIVTLVCKLPRGAGVASVLQPLLALASQTRAEDIDLAIHAELEGIRRALLRLPVGGSTDDEMGQTGDGQAVGLQRDGKRKSKDSSIGYAIAGTEEEDTKTISTDAAGPVRKATQEASLQDTRKSRPKPEAAITSPLMVVLAGRRQLVDGPQVPRPPLGIRLPSDEDSSEQANAHGSRPAAATGELAVRTRDESRAVTSSAPPLMSLEGFIMGRSVQGISTNVPPSGGRHVDRQLQDVEERRIPLKNQQSGGVDCGFLGYFGRPMWHSDPAVDQSLFIQPERVDNNEERCNAVGPSAGTPFSKTPLPAALFSHVAMCLGAEDVAALASVCRSLRWIAFHRDTWKSLCFSAGFVSYSPLTAKPRQRGARATGKSLRCARPSVAQPDYNTHLYKTSGRRERTSDSCFRSQSSMCNSLHLQDWPLSTGSPRESVHSSESADLGRKCGVDCTDAVLPCETAVGWRSDPSGSGIHPLTAADTAWEAGTHCRGLQVLSEYTLHELVDWRFLFLLNRISPGPRIHVHVRELQLQFPMYPVVPDSTNVRRCSVTGGSPTCDGQDCGSGEHDKQRQSKCNARRRWLRPEEFVSTFIHRALNISQPMRLRHLRPGNRPGLCVAEILREQHYLLEWQVPLRYLQEPSVHSSRCVAEPQGDSTPVWPLPPYGSLELGSLAQVGRSCRREETITVHNVVDERPRRSQAPEVDAVHDDWLMLDVLDRGSVVASLLSPLSFGTTAAAIFVSAVLVAVATSSATAAITTAAAATATLAARRSRLFRVDLHVLERDEHEDDQEEGEECDISQPRLVSSFSGSRGLATVAASGYGSNGHIGGDAIQSASGQPTICDPASTGSVGAVGGQGGACVGGNFRPRLPLLRQLFQDRLARLFHSSTLASAALTETSRALACNILSIISRDAMTTASAVLAAAGTALAAVLRPPGARRCRPAGNAQPRGGGIYMRTAQKQRLPQGGIQLTPSSGLQRDVEAEGKCLGKHLDSSTSTKSLRLLKQLPTHSRGSLGQLQGKGGLRELRRRGTSGDSAFLRSPPAASMKPRRSQSFLSVCIGHFEAFHRRSCCSMPARFPRSSVSCDIFDQAGGSGSITHGMETLSMGAAILQHPQREVRRSLWRSASTISESISRETEREDTSSSDQERPRSELNRIDVPWPPTRELSERNFGSSSSGWHPESPPLQPGDGLLLFVRTSLPPETLLSRSRRTANGYSVGTSEWDAASASSFTGLPEDVPLLLPTDATITDLVRLLFLTLAERKYMLPLISTTPVGESPLRSTHLDGVTDRPHCGRRKSRSGQTTHSSRVALLRFWLASTHPNREHHVEQPPPSAKLAADLRLTSCERLTLAVMPFSLARRGASACADCLTLTCAPRGPSTQKPGLLRGNSAYVHSGTTTLPCNAQQYPPEDTRPPNEASPWLLSPLSAWTQDNTLSVVTGTPAEGEPTLVLRREAALEPVCRTAEPSGSYSHRESCLHAEDLSEELWPHSCPTNSEQDGANVLDNAASAYLLPDIPRTTETTGASKHKRIALGDIQHDQHAGALHSNAGLTTPTGTSAEPCVGITLEEDAAKPCKPWILQSSVNARQFEYHPAKSNVLLTGNNDGRVRVLDWKRDAVLGTELVDSHPILALSWLKHHPELFVCAAGVSGIPYVVRWREQDDLFANEAKCDRGRMPKALVSHFQPSLPLSMQSRQPAQQQQRVEVCDYEASHDDQYSGDRDDCIDGSTVTAALTWFRRCGRGERLGREGTASLRIVHQYCACEDLSSVSVNSTDDYLLVSGRSADLTIHDVATGARLGTLSGLHSDSINIVRFAHSSPHLFVTASFDQTCRLWDLRQRINSHQPLLTVDTGSLSVMCCFDDSDEWLLCSGVDAALRQVCLRSSTVFPQSFAIPPVNAETNFRRAVYLQGGREFITAGTEEGFFRVFSRLGRDLGLVSLEGLLRPFIRVRSSQGLATLADLQAELLNLRIYLRSHMALGLSAMSDAALATAAGVSRSSVAAVLRTALRHLGGGPTGLLDMDLLERMRQAVNGSASPWFFIWQQGMRSEPSLFQEAGTGGPENNVVEEYVQSLRAHPQERRLVGALLATKDQVETANGEASYVAMSRLPATMLG